ncbi:MAG TPA: XrtA system polysaccharide chain length determinant, partial [Acetobacteraceae bacterium]
TYRNKNPKMAHDVVQTLLTIFVESATGNNRSEMDNARLFLEHQIASYEQQLRAAEKRRADFRARYIEILPTISAPGVPALEAARNNVAGLDGKLQDLILARDAMKDEVDKTPPMLVAETAGRQATAAQNTRLQQAEDQLRMLLLKDTDQHPDVIAQRKLIESLKTAPPEPAETPKGAAAAASGPTNRSVPNPVYDELKVKLIDIDSQVAALQRQHVAAVAYREKLEKIQQEQPGLIAEYEDTDRDYNVLRGSYQALLERLQSANIAQAADTQADKVKLQIVDPPEIPRLPAAPNRMLLVTAVLLVGCGAGLGVTVLFGQVDQSFSTADDLRSLGMPVLGGISILGLASFRQRLTIAARFGVAVVLLVGIYGGLIVHILRSSALI